MMKPEIKERWLKALRSGEYEQGESALKTNDDKFCCLGVLCDLYIKEKGLEWIAEKDKDAFSNDNGIRNTIHGTWAYVPKEVQEWAGLSDQNPNVQLPQEKVSLGVVNDLRRENFEAIATLIENNL